MRNQMRSGFTTPTHIRVPPSGHGSPLADCGVTVMTNRACGFWSGRNVQNLGGGLSVLSYVQQTLVFRCASTRL